jgi:hypothetical protein
MFDMTGIDFEAFAENYRDAQVYQRRAEQFRREGQHATVVFDVAAVALERYLIALCELYGRKPRNHNYTCLMDDAETMIDFPPLLNKEIRSLDLIFGICPLDDYHHGSPETSDADRVRSMCNQVRKLFDQTRIKLLGDTFKDHQK